MKQNCPKYCCGDCSNRYCCKEISLRLDQKECFPENCTTFYDSYGYHYQAIDCGTSKFCCGSCENRYCCLQPSLKFNQSSCPTTTETAKITNTENYWQKSFNKISDISNNITNTSTSKTTTTDFHWSK